jgi:cob(I)alamin adenosyltransferase
MQSFYTRKGDDGTTGLLGEGRVPKFDPRLEALGAIDETSAALGLARCYSQAAQTREMLEQVQRDLYGIMAEVAATAENTARFHTIGAEQIGWLELQIDTLSAVTTIPKEFILPGDTPAGAFLDQARAVARRAERRMAEEIQRGDVSNRELLQYLNRLSSLCFVLELFENQSAGKKTTLARE